MLELPYLNALMESKTRDLSQSKIVQGSFLSGGQSHMRPFKSQPRKFKEGRVPNFDIHELSLTFNLGVPLQSNY